MLNSTFFLSIFSQKRSRREGLGCWMCPCGSGPLGAGCREGTVTVSRDGTGFSHVFTCFSHIYSTALSYSQHLSAILSAIPPTSTYLRSCRLLLWSWKVWRPKKQAKRQVQTKAHRCFSRRLNMSKSRDRPPHGWQVDPGAEREAAASAAKIAVGQWISKAVMTLEIGFERNELMLDRTSRNFQDLYSSYLIQSRS